MFNEPPIILLAFAAGFYTGLYFRDTVDWLLRRFRQ